MPASVVYKLRDYKETFKFEREHPKELRRDDKYKLYMLTEDKKLQGIWLKEKTELVGEILLSWKSANVVYVENITVLSTHKGKGLGHELVKLAIEWATNSGYEWLIGQARQGASWKIFQNFGATPVLTYKDWGGTKEEYVSFKIEL